MNFLELFLGIMTALGGFVDISELVFAMAAGAKFAYATLWVVVLGTIGIALFGEMSGRIAVVTQKPTFILIRDRVGHRHALIVLIASNLVNLLTCTAEIGGIAVVLRLLWGIDYRLMLVVSAALMILLLYALEFKWIERVFGLLGLMLLVFIAVAWKLEPQWIGIARGLIPAAAPAGESSMYWYFVVGLFSSILMPYEVYFYSSGAIEGKWKAKDLPMNVVNAGIGFTLGGLLTMALIVVGAEAFFPRGIDPQVLGSSALPAALAYGVPGLLAALLGMLFAMMGAAAETALAGAYNFAQFFGYAWGKCNKPGEVPVFTAAWISMFVAGFAIALSGIDPVQFVEYSVLFAIVVLPFTYYPILRVASDAKAMGKHVNSKWTTALGWIYFVLIAGAAAASLPLMWVTHMGQG